MFLDTDDVLVGGNVLRKLCRKLDAEQPNIGAAFITYDYDKLETLSTCRLSKGPNWEFTDAIHERLVLKDGTTDSAAMAHFDGKEIRTIHRRKSPEEKEKAIRRNARIAEREFNTEDKAYKARLGRTIAMEMKMDKRFDDAIPYLKDLADYYVHLPEGKTAAGDLSRIYASKNELGEALQWAKRAGPSFEALIHHAGGQYKECILRQNVGYFCENQGTHESFILRHAVAQVALADSLFQLKKPHSLVERALNAIRPDLRTHAELGPVTMGLRSAIDRITILVPGTPQPFDESSTEGMLGGSEEAVVYLANALAKQGRNVRVYINPMPFSREPGIGPTGVDFQPLKDFSIDNENGNVVVWRSFGMVEQIIHEYSTRVSKNKAGDETSHVPTGNFQVSLWLHDQHLGVHPQRAQPILESLQSVIVLSDHHLSKIKANVVDPSKINFVKLANGICFDELKAVADKAVKDPFKVVYSSCPSRGLRDLLRMWPEVKKAKPEAHLEIFYDWAGVSQYQPELFKDLMGLMKSVEGMDVRHHGGVGHTRLYEEIASANVWAYSHFENPGVETFCISAVKAAALGTTVLTVPNGALREVVPLALFDEDKVSYRDRLIHLLGQKMNDGYIEVCQDDAKSFDWDKVASDFSRVWSKEFVLEFLEKKSKM
jgi:hypothetical protein